jgi:hypothetical protein
MSLSSKIIPVVTKAQGGLGAQVADVPKQSGGSGFSLRSDALDSVGERYTHDDFRQGVLTIEAKLAFVRGPRRA